MGDSTITHYLDSVLGNVFTGAASDAVIAILLLVVVGMGVAIWFLCKALYKREKQYQDQLAAHSDALKLSQQRVQEVSTRYAETLQDLSTRYVATLQELNNEYNDSARETARALTELRIALVEVKIVVNSTMLKR